MTNEVAEDVMVGFPLQSGELGRVSIGIVLGPMLYDGIVYIRRLNTWRRYLHIHIMDR